MNICWIFNGIIQHENHSLSYVSGRYEELLQLLSYFCMNWPHIPVSSAGFAEYSMSISYHDQKKHL